MRNRWTSPSGGPPRHFQSVTCCLTCRGCVRQISSGDWKMNWGNGRGCVSAIDSLAECQATAHQETAFSVLHRKVRLPPESVPASSPYPAAGRRFPAPLEVRLLNKTFCNRHAVCSAPADKKAGILPGCDVYSVSDFFSSSSESPVACLICSGVIPIF